MNVRWRSSARNPRALLLTIALSAGSASASTVTWLEQVQAELTCTSMADEAERQALAAPVPSAPRDERVVSACFRDPGALRGRGRRTLTRRRTPQH